MRKLLLTVAGSAFLATGLVTPAQAATPDFANCTEANEAGYYNIPASSPVYKKKFDRDGDGVGCDHPDPTKRGTYIHPETAPAPKPAPEPAPAPNPVPKPAPKPVEETPAPAPDVEGPTAETGYAATDNTGVALAGGAALLLAGGAVTVAGVRSSRR